MDAEIAAADDDASALTGLAALDAEIAAARSRADAQREAAATAATPAPPRPRAGGADAVTPTTTAEAPGGANRSAAAAGSAARGLAERRYLAALRRALARERHYPPTARRRGLEGTARVQFTIAADGGFSGIRVSHSAGAAGLDDAAERTVRRLARFEPIPAVIGREQWTVRVPIVFRLN